jgi:uncharacterized damage-inducible protein DinB
MGKSAVIKHINASWQNLIYSLEGLPESAYFHSGVCGTWSIRDILNHISTWEEEALSNIPLILAGKPTPRYASSGGISAFNTRAQQAKQAYSLQRIEQELTATHQRFLDYLASLPEACFVNNPRLIKRIRLDSYGHYAEHTAQICLWRSTRCL